MLDQSLNHIWLYSWQQIQLWRSFTGYICTGMGKALDCPNLTLPSYVVTVHSRQFSLCLPVSADYKQHSCWLCVSKVLTESRTGYSAQPTLRHAITESYDGDNGLFHTRSQGRA